jgi:hypothetical protein
MAKIKARNKSVLDRKKNEKKKIFAKKNVWNKSSGAQL